MAPNTRTVVPKSRRRRRTPESARREILDAAARRLAREGPDGLRLQAIAGDLDISHTSILHHFGSREGLLEALAADAFEVLERDLKRSLAQAPEADPETDLFEKIAAILGERGHARLLAWQIMSGRPVADSDAAGGLLGRLAETLHAFRVDHARANGRRTPTPDETRAIVAFTACALFGEALAGEVMLRSAGLETEPAARRDFRRWIAGIVGREAFRDESTAEGAP